MAEELQQKLKQDGSKIESPPASKDILVKLLENDQLDIRLKAVGLVGDLFALPSSDISEAFQPILLEFLKRLTDGAVEVQMSVLERVKICLLTNPLRAEAPQIISALCDRLLDHDENVRKEVVAVVCDVACHSLTSIPVGTIKLVADRLQDKSLLVKSYTMERLSDIFRGYCLNRSSDLTKNDEYDWIVGKLLRCVYDKDYRSDTSETLLCLSLFPTDFSVKNKVANWVRIFSGFDKLEVKALEEILEQKQRLQQEMLKYLSLRELSQEGDVTEIQKKVNFCFRSMSHFFADPASAEENFQILDQLKDSNVWKILTSLLDPNTSSLQACSSRDDLLRALGEKHQIYEFLSSLSLKCSYLLFNKEHVKELILEASVQKSSGSTELISSTMTILVILARFSPLLLCGIEEDLMHLLEDDNEIFKEGVLHILAMAGGTIREQLGVSSRSLDLMLERICIEGSRRQAKYAVHALASVTKDDGLMSLSVLYKRLVDMLEEKSCLPAVLQSLGCIAQIAMPEVETRESDVEEFIKKNILEKSHMSRDEVNECWNDRSELCSLKIFGVKTLVKSYLPIKDAHLRSGIDDLVEILKNILSFGEISRDVASSLVDKAHMKLAAAKAVLRLSRHWEHKIPVDVFYMTLRTSETSFPEVKKLLLNKVHQYVKDQILEPKFACTFILDYGSQQLDFEENKCKLNDIIRMCKQERARQVSTRSDANSAPLYPEYILPYVVHGLAHHSSCPDVDECKDVKAFETIYSHLYLLLPMLITGDEDGKSDDSFSKEKESISLLNSIFLSIKRSEDAFDAIKSKNSYAVCDLGLSIIVRLAQKHKDLQDLGASVVLPPMLYRPPEKKEGNDLLVGEKKTWLADKSILAQFESLKFEANGAVNIEIAEDKIMKDSERDGSEMRLGKFVKHLKEKGVKAKGEVTDEFAPAGVGSENDFDILKTIKEKNVDSLGTTRKLESSKGHEYVYKKSRSGQKLQTRKMICSESKDVSVPKRRRSSSVQGYKSLQKITSKGSIRPTDVNDWGLSFDSPKMDKEFHAGSEDKSMHDIMIPAESDLVSYTRETSSSSKQKGKRAHRDHGEAHDGSNHDAEKRKKVVETESACPVSNSKPRSTKRQVWKSVAGLTKCSSKDNGSYKADLIGSKIKVWWPMDKMFYEGVVQSFDTQTKKHEILYDDGDVEVLQLNKERWELLDIGRKDTKLSNSTKGSRPEGVSSNQKQKSKGYSKRNEKLAETSPSSRAKGKRTPQKYLKQRQHGLFKISSSTKSVGSPDVKHPESVTKSIVDDLDSEEQNDGFGNSSADEQQTDKDEKQMEDAKDESGGPIESKEEEHHSEDTQSEDVNRPPHDAHRSNNNTVHSSDEKQSGRTRKESRLDAEEADDVDTHPAVLDEPSKKTASADFDADFSDNEPLGTWKRRVGNNRRPIFLPGKSS
ncbi:hypothetical protein Adt_42917 [Abeliophyllum distichum]|uniref:Uncharacterized protein n=1 Tax=Abeliophyllum distichum TaxID=126358 RepID=A0ABD1PX09_9LAMI